MPRTVRVDSDQGKVIRVSYSKALRRYIRSHGQATLTISANQRGGGSASTAVRARVLRPQAVTG